MKIKHFCCGILLALFTVSLYAQEGPLIVPQSISLPADTTLRNELIGSLNGFISQFNKPNKENSFVLNSDLLATSDLLDEMKDMSASKRLNDENFYKPYLTNLTQLNDSSFLIQFSNIGINENKPILRASFTLIATKKENQFYFNSPLKRNTITWKTQKIDNTIIYYKNNLNSANAAPYFKMIKAYDKKLNAPNTPTYLYCADNFQEALYLLGVDYKLDYNGVATGTLTENENNSGITIDGTLTSNFTTFDPHDLWHDRLHRVISLDTINRPVDEGTAYLYGGGSWGISWKEVLQKFKNYAAENPAADWLALYNENKNYTENEQYHLNVDYVINALIIQKIERDKGFAAVLELLCCGKKQEGNKNYFTALEKITGITEANFNKEVWALIKAN